MIWVCQEDYFFKKPIYRAPWGFGVLFIAFTNAVDSKGVGCKRN